MKIVKKSLKVKDLRCLSCTLLIDSSLEEVIGVREANTSLTRCRCEVEYDEETVSLERIIEVITASGYTVELAV